MAPMVEMVGKVTRNRYDELVAESLDRVEEGTRCQFALGDAALELEPLRGHGGHLPLDEGDQGGEESLRLFADELGLSFYTVRTHRWVAAQWPAERRQAGVSYEVHRILASAADGFELIGNPPLSERTGRRRWSAEVAKKVVGWKTEEIQVPVTAQEKVEAIRELARDDEAVAAQVATDFLRRPEVAFKAMRDAEARENVNEAQGARRNVRDYERLVSHSEAHITWTFITLMVRRLTRPPRPPRTPPHMVEPVKVAGKPKPIRIRRLQPQTIRLASAVLS